MAILLFNLWPFTTMTICQKMPKFEQNFAKHNISHPKNCRKTFKILPKWRNFAQSGHTVNTTQSRGTYLGPRSALRRRWWRSWDPEARSRPTEWCPLKSRACRPSSRSASARPCSSGPSCTPSPVESIYVVIVFLKKWTNPGLFMFISVFQHVTIPI